MNLHVDFMFIAVVINWQEIRVFAYFSVSCTMPDYSDIRCETWIHGLDVLCRAIISRENKSYTALCVCNKILQAGN